MFAFVLGVNMLRRMQHPSGNVEPGHTAWSTGEKLEQET